MEKLYCATSPYLDGCKIGCWNGTVKDLSNRYRTPYGAVNLIVYACNDYRLLEACVHEWVSEHHRDGEIFTLEAVDKFIDFCNFSCHDSVPNENTSHQRKIAAVAARKAERLAHKRKRSEAKIDEDTMLDTVLDKFIHQHCVTDKDSYVQCSQFRHRVNMAMGIDLDAKKLKQKMKVLGFPYRNIRVKGHKCRVYCNVQLK